MLVPGGVLIKLLSCCWESKLYNQWIKNSPFFGGEEGKEEEGRRWCFETQEVSHQARHGRSTYCLSILQTFHSIFLRHSSLLESAIPMLQFLLEAAQRQEVSTSDVFIPPLLALPFSASAREPLPLAVELGKGTAGSRGWSISACCVWTYRSSLACLSTPSPICSFTQRWFASKTLQLFPSMEIPSCI